MRPTFVYKLTPVRPTLIQEMTPAEERIIGEHFAYLQRLLAAGQLILAGPCLDGAFGVTIFEADSEADAKAIMDGDPAITGGVMTAELHAFKVSLLRGQA